MGLAAGIPGDGDLIAGRSRARQAHSNTGRSGAEEQGAFARLPIRPEECETQALRELPEDGDALRRCDVRAGIEQDNPGQPEALG
jgi:hypothetical protein